MTLTDSSNTTGWCLTITDIKSYIKVGKIKHTGSCLEEYRRPSRPLAGYEQEFGTSVAHGILCSVLGSTV